MDVFASLKGLFLFSSSLLLDTQPPAVLIKWGKAAKKQGALVASVVQEKPLNPKCQLCRK